MYKGTRILRLPVTIVWLPDLEPDGKTKERSTNMPEKNGEENIRTLT